MNTKRRTLGAALDMLDERMAFIKEGILALVPPIANPSPNSTVVELTKSQELKFASSDPEPFREPGDEPIVEAHSPQTAQSSRRNRTRNSRREQANDDTIVACDRDGFETGRARAEALWSKTVDRPRNSRGGHQKLAGY